MPTGHPDVKKLRFKEASRLLKDGVSKAEVARRLGVGPDTVAEWVKAGKVGDHLLDAPRKNGRPRKIDNPNLKLPPLVIQDQEIKKQVEGLAGEGAFSAHAAGKYEEFWFRLSRHLDHIIEHTSSDLMDPKGLKDWVDVLQKLQTQIEAYKATARNDLSEGELSQMQALQERRKAMAELYQKAEGEK